MSKNCNLVIQKADKGNLIVIVEKDVYLRHMETILSNYNKFEKVSIKKGILNFSINHEKNINNYLKRPEKPETLPSKQYKKLKQSEVDQEFYMDFVKYIKPLLIFIHHLHLHFLQLELLVINLQNF